MGGSKTTSTTNTTQGVSKFAQPAYSNLYGAAGKAYAATPKTAGQLYAPENASQQQAVGMLKDWALGSQPAQAQGDVRGAIGQLQKNYAPIDFSNALSGAVNPYYQKLTEQILPGARSAAIAQGAYDSPRQDITNGELIRDYWTNPVADIAGQYQYQSDQAQKAYALNAGGQIGNLSQLLSQMQLQPMGVLGAAGGQQQAWAQALKDAQAKAPWAGLGEYSNILANKPPMDTSQVQTEKQGGGFGDIFKGLIGAASLFG